MRKELTVFINTIEKNEELSVSSVASNRKYVILSNGGTKFTASLVELQVALSELTKFNEGEAVNNVPLKLVEDNVLVLDDVEYLNEE